jgi:hypothetical protein
MAKAVYTTAELLTILAEERRACMEGRRLDLAARPSYTNPLLNRFIEPVGIQKFTAYEKFRATIHAYQHEHQVSGLVWQELHIGEDILQFPMLHEQLTSLQSDLRILRAAKPKIYEFWQRTTRGMNLFLSLQQGKVFTELDDGGPDRIAARSEWASIDCHGHQQNLEVILQLGWGNPESALYRRGFPESGCEFIHACYPGKQPI